MLSHHPSALAVCVPKCDPTRRSLSKSPIETNVSRRWETLVVKMLFAFAVMCARRFARGQRSERALKARKLASTRRLTTQSFRDRLSRDFSRPVFLQLRADCNAPFGTPAPAASATALAIWPGGVLVWVDSGGKIWISTPPELGKHCGGANGRQGRRVVRSKPGMLELPSRFA
jgi:hypothetical protein